MSFPIELYIEIARNDRWQISGSFARASKTMLAAFVDANILREIMDSVKCLRCPLFKWMRFALPSCYFNTPKSKKDAVLSPMTRMLDNTFRSGTYLISGGIVCQHIYGKEWQSDIDVYVPRCRVQSEEYATYQNSRYDIHPVDTDRLERVIEDFDLSIVQQGFMSDEYFLTPLAFYTQHWHEIVAMPRESNINYRMPERDATFKMMSRTLWYYINLHQELHHEYKQPFHECDLCDRVQGMTELIKWRERVCKYSERFKSFSIIYCKPSF